MELKLLKDVFFSIDSSGFAPSRVPLQNIYSDRVSVQLYYRINSKLLVCFTHKRDFLCRTFLKRCPKQKREIDNHLSLSLFIFKPNVQICSLIHDLSLFILSLEKCLNEYFPKYKIILNVRKKSCCSFLSPRNFIIFGIYQVLAKTCFTPSLCTHGSDCSGGNSIFSI